MTCPVLSSDFILTHSFGHFQWRREHVLRLRDKVSSTSAAASGQLPLADDNNPMVIQEFSRLSTGAKIVGCFSLVKNYNSLIAPARSGVISL